MRSLSGQTLSREEILKNPDWRDFFEERAAIREYDGGLTRVRAEILALHEVRARFANEQVHPD